ncbi:hypothetical protein Tco_0920482, partial [Tanacetum coccineum]
KEVSKITPKIEKLVNEQLESEVLVRSSKEAKTSHAIAANLSELELKKILIDKMEANNSINRSDIQRQLYKALVDAYEANKILLRWNTPDDDQEPSVGTHQGSKRRRSGKEPESTSAPREKTTTTAGKNTTGSKTHKQSASVEETMQSTDVFDAPAHQEFEIGVHDEQVEEESVPAVHKSVQPWLSNLARRQDPRESFDELTDTTFDFSAFVMNRLNVKTLTPELLAGPTFELMKGTCKSFTELEYFCEEVYKATTEKLDWINPEGRQYPHDLRKPLPLVPNSQGRHVIPFHHFINNDLEYLRGGESSRKYSTSVTKTKAADYGHIKWIEDLVPNSMWSQVIVNYDKFALWGVSHWGKKRRQFYAFAITRESARDVYSKRRIIAVTKVEIVEWQNYKHLDWITVRRDDDILYKFKEGDFHRLRIQDIEDMLLLLVQGKLTNLNVEERIAFNVSLRMFTRSVVIQRRVEDLQLGVESYQKKLNLTKPDTYRSNLRRRDAYTPYSDPRGFIYENKDKKNRLMRIDELHKFSDGTLDDVRTALNDRLKGIRMEYLPQTFWSQRDKVNARAMIQAIDKRLKTRRIFRSLERFVGGRPYGDSILQARNPVKEILLKLNLPDHRSILTDSKVTPTKHGRMTKPYSSPRFIANCFNEGYLKMEVKRRSVKGKEPQRCIIKAFQVNISRKVLKITYSHTSQVKGTSSSLKSMITTPYSQEKDKEKKTTRYGEAVKAKGTLRKSLLPPRWRLLMAQIIQCLGEDLINKLNKKTRERVIPYLSEDEPVEFKAPKTSLKAEKKVTQGTNPHVLVEKIKSASEGLETEEFNTFPDLSSSDDAKKEIKLEDLSKLMQNVDVDFMDLDSLEDDQPHIVQEHDEEKVTAEKMVLKSKSLPTELKELPSKFNDLSREIKELKKYVEKLEVEILRDLKEIPSKLEKFTSTVSSLTTQVAELKTLQWELPAKFLSIPGQVSSIQAKSPFLFSSPKIPPQPKGELIKKDKEGEHMHLTAHQIKEQKRLYETTKVEMAKKQEEVVKEELIDLLFFEVVTSYYIAELQKGPITLKVYREDGNDEVILDFKASDLHLSEWREVMHVCPSRKEARWSTIYEQIKKIMDYLHKTKAKLGIDFSKPLIEQEPLDKLNDLAKKEEKT